LPHSSADFKTKCSCPDWSNPCKHIAGVYYLVAAKLDEDPFLLFELRGLSREQLQKELAKSELGKLLSSALDEQNILPESVNSYYTEPKTVELAKVVDPTDFWFGEKRVPQTVEAIAPATIPGIIVKKAGDYPSFWQENSSFLTVMEEFYERARAKLISGF
ncbi:MAG: SWIM zinc finger family protein, partial [Microcystaceae cyanobacterium]